MPPTTISIHGHEIDISAPFAPGHICTAGDAEALNGLRAENIRNNARRRYGREAEQMDIDLLRRIVETYDANYRFLSRVERSERANNALRSEARAICSERTGEQQAEPDDGLLSESDWAAAQERLQVRRQLALRALGEL